MQQSRRFYVLPFYFFIVGGLVCVSLVKFGVSSIDFMYGTNITNISDIKPQQDNNATVYLQGKVAHHVPLLGWQMYQLQDPSGKIWVLTDQKDLQLNDKVLIKGNVHYQSIPLAGKDFGEAYVRQQQQLEHTPAP
ncbi:MAG: DNA-binding protein [Gloeocapsa sp. UFS-A4-WI-NPMV-4B04]|jgi:hypothetical protein|nr:DNA-binding protein [Gloeocapsa sp. UFS-A4-WI-NPMV-4B04]